MTERITSRKNPRIKQVRALQNRKSRDATRLFVVEGIRHVGEAWDAKAQIAYLFYVPEMLTSPYAEQLVERVREEGVPCISTTVDVFSTLARKEQPQGILAVVVQQVFELESLTPQNFPWGVALVSPQDPGNVGAILRTLNAAGASGLLLLEGGVDPYHPTSVRASMGALFYHSIAMTSFDNFTTWVRKHGYQVYGTSTRGAIDYRLVSPFRWPAILLMGSEREGLTPNQADLCSTLIRIPMHGQMTSLNLAVATGILLYEMAESFHS